MFDGYLFPLSVKARNLGRDTQKQLRCPHCSAPVGIRGACKSHGRPQGARARLYAACRPEGKRLVDETAPLVVAGFLKGFEGGLSRKQKPGFFERIAHRIRVWRGEA